MAGRRPDIWAAVSAWVPLSDIYAWFVESRLLGTGYDKDIEAICGGNPQEDEQAMRECKLRSPSTYLVEASEVPLDINAGIHDGHTGSVPISQSLRAFNVLAEEKDRISEEHIRYFVEHEAVPGELVTEIEDASYGNKPVLFRRKSNRVRITIFEGGHEIVYPAAMKWLGEQVRK